MVLIPKSDRKTGASCTGVDGATGRTLVLDTVGAISTSMNVWVGGTWFEPVTDYTFVEATRTITFNAPVSNFMAIYVTYFISDTTTVYPSYTSTLQVVRATGIGVEVFNEHVGTGGSSASFDLDNGNVIASSYTLKYGASGSNELTDLTEYIHYNLLKDEGLILLTSAGLTAVGVNELYASYTYSPKMSDTVISTYILSAEKEVERKTGNYWGSEMETTEYFSGRSTTYPTTDEPYATDWDEPDSVVLKYRGCTELTSVDFLTRGGTTVTEESVALTAVDLNPTNSVVTFLNNRIPNGTRNVKVVYKHGYDTVDYQVAELAAYMAGLRIYAYITGGSYDDATGFTLGRKQVQIGEVYVNVREVVRQFEVRIASILDDLGSRMYVC